jgi:hypothetical protein
MTANLPRASDAGMEQRTSPWLSPLLLLDSGGAYPGAGSATAISTTTTTSTGAIAGAGAAQSQSGFLGDLLVRFASAPYEPGRAVAARARRR